MRRVFLPLLLMTLLLAACGTSVDLTKTAPPNAKEIAESTGNAQIDAVLTSWRNSVPQAMEAHQIKAESIKQTVYSSTDSLDAVQSYYVDTFAGKDGWNASTRTPGVDASQGVLIDGYEHGTSSLVIGAIDASKYGGSGVIVYTVTGNK